MLDRFCTWVDSTSRFYSWIFCSKYFYLDESRVFWSGKDPEIASFFIFKVQISCWTNSIIEPVFRTSYLFGLPDPDPLLFVRIQIQTLLLLQSWSRLRKNEGFIIFPEMLRVRSGAPCTGKYFRRGTGFFVSFCSARSWLKLELKKCCLLTWVTWLLISVGPGGSSLEMLLASVASART